jgi:FkbH-like protein
MESIKLVIWDLDDTFWQGVLTEGGITPIADNVAIVEELTRRGILNSIASHNPLDAARDALVRLGVWKHFVFPQIRWSAKGGLVADILRETQLRSPNTLFIDDNPRNLDEVRSFNPGIHVAAPDFLGQMLSHPGLQGKPDPGRSRLRDYRLLETRVAERKRVADDQQFLMGSNIRVRFVEDLADHVERVYELLERTNQLNFTKVRLSRAATAALLADGARRNAAIHVVDRFGDHGLVGFYSLDPRAHRLEHFVFSCRILNLGVEQFVYAYLGDPQLDIRGEVAATLRPRLMPSWVSLGDERDKLGAGGATGAPSAPRVLMKGGCDIGPLVHYLRDYDFLVDEESGMADVHGIQSLRGHSEDLLASLRRSGAEASTPEPEGIFVDPTRFETRVWGQEFDVLVYSPMVDYLQHLYRDRKTGEILPFGGFTPVTAETIEHWLSRSQVAQWRRRDPNTADGHLWEFVLRRFVDRYECLGQITPDRFVENLRVLRDRLDSRIPLVILNGAEVEVANEQEPNAHARHALMNAALERFVAESGDCYMVDVRKHVCSPGDVTDNIRHYTARAAFGVAADIAATITRARSDRPLETPDSQQKTPSATATD